MSEPDDSGPDNRRRPDNVRRPGQEPPRRCPHCGELVFTPARDPSGAVAICPRCRLPLAKDRLA